MQFDLRGALHKKAIAASGALHRSSPTSHHHHYHHLAIFQRAGSNLAAAGWRAGGRASETARASCEAPALLQFPLSRGPATASSHRTDVRRLPASASHEQAFSRASRPRLMAEKWTAACRNVRPLRRAQPAPAARGHARVKVLSYSTSSLSSALGRERPLAHNG